MRKPAMQMNESFRSRRMIASRSARMLLLIACAASVIVAAPRAGADDHRTSKADKAKAATERTDGEIRRVLDEQVEAWNRGDMEGFLAGYSDSDATLYVGKHTERGFTAIAANYRQNFPTKAKMGRLTFSDLDVHLLDQDYSAVVGRFSLARSAEAGGDTSGVFSLILEKTAQGWKIVLDHTS